MTLLASPEQLAIAAQRQVPPATAAELLKQASGLVRDHCGWHIAPVQELELVCSGSGTNVLLLPVMQVRSVSAVRIGDPDSADPPELLVPGRDYRWTEAGALRRPRGQVWPDLERSVTVVCEAGFDTAPPGVAAVVAAAAARIGAGQWSVQQIGSLRLGRGAGDPVIGWTAREEQILERYRRRS